MDFTAEGILSRMKNDLKNDDSRIEGSFTMDNLQAVSEELARFNAMQIIPLQELIARTGEDMATSGNKSHYIKWAKEAVNGEGKVIVGNAKVNAPRDKSGEVYIAIITTEAKAPTEDEIRIVQEYIDTKHPTGAEPIVIAAESIDAKINCTVKKLAGHTDDTIKAAIRSKIQEHILMIAFESGAITLNFYRISNIIGSVDGVADLVELTINGDKESITADYDNFFSLKELIINVTE